MRGTNSNRTTKSFTADTTYKAINTNSEPVFAIHNATGQVLEVRFNVGAGFIPLADGVTWEFSDLIGGVVSEVAVKMQGGTTGSVYYII